MRKPLLTTCTLLLLLSILPAAIFADDNWRGHHGKLGVESPQVIPLPNGFQPEGIVRGRGHTAYVGSLKTGGIYQLDLLTGVGELLVAEADNPAVGLAFDKRSNYLFVAGGPGGTVTVYDSIDGQLKTVYSVAQPGATFINDGVVTRDAAYFTDSFAPAIYRIPLARNGRLPSPEAVETIALGGDFEFVPGGFNANGITSSWKGSELYVVNSTTGQLYRVDPQTGEANRIEINNGDLVNGDGILFYRNKLYVVQNFFNQIAELKLFDKKSRATITRILTDPDLSIPTTSAAFDGALFAVNARFDVAPPPFFGNPSADPTLQYSVVKVDLKD